MGPVWAELCSRFLENSGSLLLCRLIGRGHCFAKHFIYLPALSEAQVSLASELPREGQGKITIHGYPILKEHFHLPGLQAPEGHQRWNWKR